MPLDFTQLKTDKSQYPHHDDVPSQLDKIKEREWDCLICLDACRWDAMEILLEDQSRHDLTVEKCRTPSENSTPGWLHSVWNKEVADWSDVTYVMGNPIADWLRESGAKFDYHDLKEHVGEYVPTWHGNVFEDRDCAWDAVFSVTRPDKFYDIVRRQDPPVVAHFLQPHTPFVGQVGMRISNDNQPIVPFQREGGAESIIMEETDEDIVSMEYYQAAYMENLLLGWEWACELEKFFDNVVYTADHGEAVGPDRYDHGGPKNPHNRVVPWVETWS